MITLRFRLIAQFTISVLWTTWLGATAPDRIVGAVFSETRVFQSLNNARPPQLVQTTVTNVFILNSDHTFSRIQGSYPAPKGTWSYEKLTAETAMLVLAGDDLRLTAFDRILEFSTGTFRDGSIGTISRTFTFIPFSERSRVINISSRSFIRPGTSATAGFVVTGESAFVLVRAVGPGLHQFGVSSALRLPRVKVLRTEAGVLVAANDGWTSGSAELAQRIAQMASIVGAFPLGQNSADSALILELPAGAYVADVSSIDPAESGEVLIEVYLLP